MFNGILSSEIKRFLEDITIAKLPKHECLFSIYSLFLVYLQLYCKALLLYAALKIQHIAFIHLNLRFHHSFLPLLPFPITHPLPIILTLFVIYHRYTVFAILPFLVHCIHLIRHCDY